MMDNLKTSVSPAIGYYDDEDGYEAPKVTQFIVVRFGEEQYGIDIKYIDNIVRMQQIRRVPEVPPASSSLSLPSLFPLPFYNKALKP